MALGVIAVAFTGYFLLNATRAAAPTAKFEAENATLTNGATVGINVQASGGSFTQFNAAPTPPPPPPPPQGTRTCPAYPAMPDASCTGVPAGTTLTPSGSITTTQDGQVIDSKDVNGWINVQHNNVTIKRTRVRNQGQAITMSNSKTNLIIEDCELDGTGTPNGASAVGDSNFTIRRCIVHHYGEGPRSSGNVVVEDNWFHDFVSYIHQDAHQDVVQVTGGSNITFRHNVMDMNVNGANAAIMIGTSSGSNILIENNWFAGGGWTVYGGWPAYTNVRILNNRFSTKYYPNCGFYGPIVYADGHTVTGNVWADGSRAGQAVN